MYFAHILKKLPAVNSLGEIVSPCVIPFCIGIILLTICNFIVAVLSLQMYADILTYP